MHKDLLNKIVTTSQCLLTSGGLGVHFCGTQSSININSIERMSYTNIFKCVRLGWPKSRNITLIRRGHFVYYMYLIILTGTKSTYIFLTGNYSSTIQSQLLYLRYLHVYCPRAYHYKNKRRVQVKTPITRIIAV